MTLLDAFAVLALLKDEPAAAEVDALVRAGDSRLTVLGVAEVIDHLVRLVRLDEDEAVLDLAQLGLQTPVEVDESLALRAALLRARRYHRRSCAVSLADCVAAEAARATGRPLATADSHLLDVCADEGISIVPLLDSTGSRWTGHP